MSREVVELVVFTLKFLLDDSLDFDYFVVQQSALLIHFVDNVEVLGRTSGLHLLKALLE